MFARHNKNTFHFELVYKMLQLTPNPDDYFLSIGTVTLSIPEIVNFDFGIHLPK